MPSPRGRVLTFYLDTWYGQGRAMSSDRMIFGEGLMDSLGFEEVHVPLEQYHANHDEMKKAKPDWIFVVPFQSVMYSLRDLFPSVPVVVWMCDDVWRYSSFGRYWSALADVIVTTCPDAAERYGMKGHLSNWAARTEWVRYEPAVKWPHAGFTGQLYGHRKQILDEIASAGTVTVDWANSAVAVQSPEDYFASVGRNEFALCLTESSAGTRQMKSRLFEPQVLGSVLVTEQVPGLDQWWTPGEECVVFDDPAHAQKQMQDLLADRDRLEAIRSRARVRALDEHTYAHRFKPILERIGVA